MTDEQVLAMPSRRFWAMESAINRISATHDMRSLGVMASSQSQEGYEKLSERLVLEMGTVAESEPDLNPEPDLVGIDLLKQMSKEKVSGKT